MSYDGDMQVALLSIHVSLQVQLLNHFLGCLEEVHSKLSADFMEGEDMHGVSSPDLTPPLRDEHSTVPLPVSNRHIMASFHLPFITQLGFLCLPFQEPDNDADSPRPSGRRKGKDILLPPAWVNCLQERHLARVCGCRLAPVLDVSIRELRCVYYHGKAEL